MHITYRDIKAPEVRLTPEGVKEGIYPTRKAIELADELGLDLVEIAAKANPPVCRIIDYNKFLYEQKCVKTNEIQQVKWYKEIRFGPNTDEHDFDFKPTCKNSCQMEQT